MDHSTRGLSVETLRARPIPPAALLAFSSVAVLEIAVGIERDRALSIALLAFLLAIPALAMWAVAAWKDYLYGASSQTPGATAMDIGAAACVYLGIGALAWHVSYAIGICYILGAFVGLARWSLGARRMPTEQPNTRPQRPAAAGVIDPLEANHAKNDQHGGR